MNALRNLKIFLWLCSFYALFHLIGIGISYFGDLAEQAQGAYFSPSYLASDLDGLNFYGALFIVPVVINIILWMGRPKKTAILNAGAATNVAVKEASPFITALSGFAAVLSIGALLVYVLFIFIGIGSGGIHFSDLFNVIIDLVTDVYSMGILIMGIILCWAVIYRSRIKTR